MIQQHQAAPGSDREPTASTVRSRVPSPELTYLERVLKAEEKRQSQVSLEMTAQIRRTRKDLLERRDILQHTEISHNKPWSPQVKGFELLLMDEQAWQQYVDKYLFTTPVIKAPEEPDELDLHKIAQNIKEPGDIMLPVPGRTCFVTFYPAYDRNKALLNCPRVKQMSRGARIPNSVIMRILWSTRTLLDVEHHRPMENRRNLSRQQWEMFEFSDEEKLVLPEELQNITEKRCTKYKTFMLDHLHIANRRYISENGADDLESIDSLDRAIRRERQGTLSIRGDLLDDDDVDWELSSRYGGCGVDGDAHSDGARTVIDSAGAFDAFLTETTSGVKHILDSHAQRSRLGDLSSKTQVMQLSPAEQQQTQHLLAATEENKKSKKSPRDGASASNNVRGRSPKQGPYPTAKEVRGRLVTREKQKEERYYVGDGPIKKHVFQGANVLEIKDHAGSNIFDKRQQLIPEKMAEAHGAKRHAYLKAKKRTVDSDDGTRTISAMKYAHQAIMTASEADAFSDTDQLTGADDRKPKSGASLNGYLQMCKPHSYFGIRDRLATESGSIKKQLDSAIAREAAQYMADLLRLAWVRNLIPNASTEMIGPWGIIDCLIRSFPMQNELVKISILQEVQTIFRYYSCRDPNVLLHALITFLHSETENSLIFAELLETLHSLNQQMDIVIVNALSLVPVVPPDVRRAIFNFLDELGLIDPHRLVFTEAMSWTSRRHQISRNDVLQKSLLRHALQFMDIWSESFKTHSKMIAEEANERKIQAEVKQNIIKILRRFDPEIVIETPEGIDVNLHAPVDARLLERPTAIEVLNYFVEITDGDDMISLENSEYMGMTSTADPNEWRKANADILIPPKPKPSFQGNRPLLAGVLQPTALVTHHCCPPSLAPVPWPTITVSISLRIADKYYRHNKPATGQLL